MIRDWHKERWIKNCTLDEFISWYHLNQKTLSLDVLPDDEIARIHNSHVLPKEVAVADVIMVPEVHNMDEAMNWTNGKEKPINPEFE